jgi:acyl carrier protein
MTQYDEVAQRVRTLIGEMSPLGAREATSPESLVDDLGYDSVTFVELALALESEFDLTAIDEQQAADLTTVGDIEQLIARLAVAAA